MIDPLYRPPQIQEWDSVFRRLKSVTIMDSRYGTGIDTPWGGIDTITIRDDLSCYYEGKYDAMGVCYWYRMMLDGRCPLETINIQYYPEDELDLCMARLAKMAVGTGSRAVRRLFGGDTFCLVDLQKEAEVRRASSILANENAAGAAVATMQRAHRDVRRREYLYHSELLQHLKFLWLDTVYNRNKERGLPARRVEQKYYWDEDLRVFVCDGKNWSEDDPEIREILQQMPKIAVVYILLESSHPAPSQNP